MTTLAPAHDTRPTTARASTFSATVGVAPFVLSVLLAIDAALASILTLVFEDALRGPAVTIGQLEGTAATVLVVGVPVLILSLGFAARGSGVAAFGWLGALAYIAYQGVMFVFATPFNAFFFLYVAMLSLSIWSLLAVLIRIDVPALARRFGPRTPVRAIAVYLVVNALLFLALWLQATVPAVLSSATPAFLEGSGMTTGVVQVIDLGFTLPLMALAATWLWQRRAWGYLLAGTLLVMLAIETTSIAVDQWIGHAADPASPLSSADLTPVFAVLTVIGIVAIGAFFRDQAGRSTSMAHEER